MMVIGIEMLVHASIRNNTNIPGLPVIPFAVVDVVSLAIQDIKRRFIDVTMVMGFCPWGQHHQMSVYCLGRVVFRS